MALGKSCAASFTSFVSYNLISDATLVVGVVRCYHAMQDEGIHCSL